MAEPYWYTPRIRFPLPDQAQATAELMGMQFGLYGDYQWKLHDPISKTAKILEYNIQGNGYDWEAAIAMLLAQRKEEA